MVSKRLVRPCLPHAAPFGESRPARRLSPLTPHECGSDGARRLNREKLTRTRIGYKGNEDNPTTRELNRVFQGMSTSYDFWIDNGLALVGSPETVLRKLKEQHAHIGYDIFCANHRFGPLPPEQSLKSMQLFGKEVIPAFTHAE